MTHKIFIKFLVLSPLIISCAKTNYAKEYISKPNKTKANNDVTLSTDIPYKLISSKTNFLVSPFCFEINHMLNDEKTLKNNNVREINESFNCFDLNFSLDLICSVASTLEMSDDKIELFKNNYVSVFIGNAIEIENSINRFYGSRISIENEGEYYFSSLAIADRFYTPLNTKTMEFNGKQSTFVERIFYGEYIDTDEYSLVDMQINKTTLTFLMPKSPNFTLENPMQGEKKSGRIKLAAPEFSLEDKIAKIDENSRYSNQFNKFEFNRYGIRGTSFTINGPTGTSPDYDLILNIDKPFYFFSTYLGATIFAGHVNEL